MNRLVYLKDVVTLGLNPEKCTGCGICLEVCPHAVLGKDDGKVRIEDLDACMECGACARNCPADALSVRAGVGCATAVINAALGRNGSSCCCVVESEGDGCGAAPEANKGSSCS